MTVAPIALVAALRETSVLFAAAIAVIEGPGADPAEVSESRQVSTIPKSVVPDPNRPIGRIASGAHSPGRRRTNPLALRRAGSDHEHDQRDRRYRSRSPPAFGSGLDGYRSRRCRERAFVTVGGGAYGRFAPSPSMCPTRNLPNCADASTRRNGRNEKRSQINRKACRSRQCKRSRAIGRPITTGARWRQS